MGRCSCRQRVGGIVAEHADGLTVLALGLAHAEDKYFTAHMRAVLAQRPRGAPIDRFERIFEAKDALVKAFHDAGGAHLITVGSDHVSWGEYLAPFGIHRELHALV